MYKASGDSYFTRGIGFQPVVSLKNDRLEAYPTVLFHPPIA